VAENASRVRTQRRDFEIVRVAVTAQPPYHRRAMTSLRLLFRTLGRCAAPRWSGARAATASAAVRRMLAALILAGCALVPSLARADAAAAPVPAALADTREQLAEDNPATFWEAEGEALWHAVDGPLQQPLDRCDLGLGAGVVRGAQAQMPRWFLDAGQVMDLEQRLMWCMVRIQGLTPAEAAARPFGSGGRHARLESLSAFIAAASRGVPVHVPADHPEEQRLLALGGQLFRYRGGDHDLACASCHSQDGRRIRLQPLANLTRPEDVRAVWTTWPAYRLSQGQVRTMQHRIRDCFRQQRFPEPVYGSEAVTALSLYLAHLAEGGIMAAPALKR
jgi:sulfur-oxidizing protein SoxA